VGTVPFLGISFRHQEVLGPEADRLAPLGGANRAMDGDSRRIGHFWWAVQLLLSADGREEVPEMCLEAGLRGLDGEGTVP